VRWKTTYDILKGTAEYFDENWMNYDTIQTPPNPKWDYSRVLQIEDVDIWEVIYEQGGAVGIYAAWCPYAEFYMVRVGWVAEAAGHGVETYYGPGAQKEVLKRAKELGIPLSINKVWVDEEDTWLYKMPESGPKTLFIP
jgi:hypothetical protein